MQCKSCGGEINPNTGICTYCGTVDVNVRRFVKGIKLETYRPGEHTLTARITVPYNIRRDLSNEAGLYILKKRFAEIFSEQIEDYIQIILQESFGDPLGDMMAIGRIIIKENK